LESRGGKILEFLRENSHLDLEVPDIAFNVKKSEKTVEAALKKFQQKGLVTARQNEYGRVYWYALPSAPITKTFKLEDLQASKGDTSPVKESSADDEVDLSELTSISNAQPKADPKEEKPESPKKARKKTVKPKKKTAPKKAEVEMPAPEFEKKKEVPNAEKAQEEFNLEDAADFDSAPPPAGKDPVTEPTPELEFESEPEPQTDSAPVPEPMDDTDEAFSPTQNGNKTPAPAPTLLIIFVLGIISIGSLIKGCGTSGKLHALESAIPKDVVVQNDLEDIQTLHAAEMAVLEKKLEAMTSQLDNLKVKVDSLAAAVTPKKKVTKRRLSTRRRRKR
jgi:DNA-binding transcriptional ArsR family regulator